MCKDRFKVRTKVESQVLESILEGRIELSKEYFESCAKAVGKAPNPQNVEECNAAATEYSSVLSLFGKVKAANETGTYPTFIELNVNEHHELSMVIDSAVDFEYDMMAEAVHDANVTGEARITAAVRYGAAVALKERYTLR